MPCFWRGRAVPNSTHWTKAVTVEWVNRLNPSQVQGSETNAQRVTVVTKYNNVPQVTLVAIRTASQ